MADRIVLYDTTLRDGAQANGVSFTVSAKLRALALLDDIGIPYVEGGWPGANPTDTEFFLRAREITLRQARLVAFGSTRRAHTRVEDDLGLMALLQSGAPVCALVGKASRFQVESVLRTTPAENLRMIGDSIAFLKQHGREVVFDAEHFFDGFKDDPDYGCSVLAAAADAGADWLVLCDTNGGTLFTEVADIIAALDDLRAPLGIHAHDDTGLAVANSLAAVQAGARMVQGTMNGYGERTGNANLLTVGPALQLKLGHACFSRDQLAQLTWLSGEFGRLSGSEPSPKLPFVGQDAFAHKAGLHADGVSKTSRAYEHIDPASVGNGRHFVVSEMAGRASLRGRVEALGLGSPSDEFLRELTQAVKDGEAQGIRYEVRPEVFERLVLSLMVRDRSAGRPAHRPAAEQVHVQVRHGVVGVTTRVDYQAVA
jgi:2-isopropylmalate synthase